MAIIIYPDGKTKEITINPNGKLLTSFSGEFYCGSRRKLRGEETKRSDLVEEKE